MKPKYEWIINRPVDDGWTEQRIRRMYNADWEDGSRYFRSLGYRNALPLHPTVIPMQFDLENVIYMYPNAVVIVECAVASTYNQPKNWTGEIQLDVDKRQNEWREDIVQLVKMQA
jgi:hypothetical protein